MADVSTAIISGSAAVLSACIALGGVYFGQILQGRRERIHRAQQWQREDRHRFADHKRDLYAEFLAETARWKRALKNMLYQPHHENEVPKGWTDWVSWVPFQSTDNSRHQIDQLLGRIRITSANIWVACQAHVIILDKATKKIGLDEPKTWSWEEVDSSLERLMDEMRADLDLNQPH